MNGRGNVQVRAAWLNTLPVATLFADPELRNKSGAEQYAVESQCTVDAPDERVAGYPRPRSPANASVPHLQPNRRFSPKLLELPSKSGDNVKNLSCRRRSFRRR